MNYIYNKMDSTFLEHPRKVCMDYYKHFTFSFSLAILFSEGAVKALVHAFIPKYYLESSTVISKEICEKIENSGCISNPVVTKKKE